METDEGTVIVYCGSPLKDHEVYFLSTPKKVKNISSRSRLYPSDA